MQDELKVKAAHFWSNSRALTDRFESEADLNVVLLHAIAPFCQMAVPRRKGLFVLKDIPEPVLAMGNQDYQNRVREIVSAARYRPDEYNKVTHLLEQHLEVTIDAIAPHLSPHAPRENLAIFELVFEKVLIEQKIVHPYHSTTVSHLAKALLPHFEKADEYFPHTGDFQIAALYASGQSAGEATSFHAATKEGLLRLRLIAHNIELLVDSAFPPVDNDKSQHLLLVDHGGRSPRDLKKQHIVTSSEILEHMLNPPLGFYALSIMVLHNALPAKAFEGLVMSRHILAIIDFETLTPAGKAKTATAIVLSAKPMPVGEKVLFIDVTKLTRWNNAAVLTSAAELAGNILTLGLIGGQTTLVSGHHRYASLLNSFCQSNFSEGYQDISGICERLSHNILQQKIKKLRAAHYLTQVSESEVPSWLDAAPILAILPPNAQLRACIYIIGNNGVGKSFLLRNLVVAISKKAVRTLGIAFGLTDRFGFTATQSPEAFQYLGAGSLRGNNTLKSYCIALANMMHQLFRSRLRQEAFHSASSSIGLSGRYYVMPWKMTSADIENDKGLSDISRLDDLTSDFELLSDFKLGLARESNGGGITPFDELSSGEQQLLSLIIKITANATPGAVVLIDEPEISLHVAWQQALPTLLDSISSSLECSFVVATHSPVITASANHSNDYCFAADLGKLSQITTTQRRSVESALFEGFNTYTPNNRQIHERCAAIVGSVIRSINQSGLVDEPAFNVFDEELKQMHQTVEGNGKNRSSPQYQDDLTLILKARLAIKELQASARTQSK